MPILESKDVQIVQKPDNVIFNETKAEAIMMDSQDINIKGNADSSVLTEGNGNTVHLSVSAPSKV
ncbi:MAG TPA: hypothetical protein DCQ37_04990 [Desulfobacteraceae bacterium]|nr:hypothetical protein [Desulfobacteraceae bacterium]